MRGVAEKYLFSSGPRCAMASVIRRSINSGEEMALLLTNPVMPHIPNTFCSLPSPSFFHTLEATGVDAFFSRYLPDSWSKRILTGSPKDRIPLNKLTFVPSTLFQLTGTSTVRMPRTLAMYRSLYIETESFQLLQRKNSTYDTEWNSLKPHCVS